MKDTDILNDSQKAIRDSLIDFLGVDFKIKGNKDGEEGTLIFSKKRNRVYVYNPDKPRDIQRRDNWKTLFNRALDYGLDPIDATDEHHMSDPILGVILCGVPMDIHIKPFADYTGKTAMQESLVMKMTYELHELGIKPKKKDAIFPSDVDEAKVIDNYLKSKIEFKDKSYNFYMRDKCYSKSAREHINVFNEVLNQDKIKKLSDYIEHVGDGASNINVWNPADFIIAVDDQEWEQLFLKKYNECSTLEDINGLLATELDDGNLICVSLKKTTEKPNIDIKGLNSHKKNSSNKRFLLKRLRIPSPRLYEKTEYTVSLIVEDTEDSSLYKISYRSKGKGTETLEIARPGGDTQLGKFPMGYLKKLFEEYNVDTDIQLCIDGLSNIKTFLDSGIGYEEGLTFMYDSGESFNAYSLENYSYYLDVLDKIYYNTYEYPIKELLGNKKDSAKLWKGFSKYLALLGTAYKDGTLDDMIYLLVSVGTRTADWQAPHIKVGQK